MCNFFHNKGKILLATLRIDIMSTHKLMYLKVEIVQSGAVETVQAIETGVGKIS